MITFVFVYDNGQQMVYTAPGCSMLSKALTEARTMMPEGATRFKMASSGHFVSGWMQ